MYLQSIVIVIITLFQIGKILPNTNKNQITNIKPFIKEKTNK